MPDIWLLCARCLAWGLEGLPVVSTFNIPKLPVAIVSCSPPCMQTRISHALWTCCCSHLPAAMYKQSRLNTPHMLQACAG